MIVYGLFPLNELKCVSSNYLKTHSHSVAQDSMKCSMEFRLASNLRRLLFLTLQCTSVTVNSLNNYIFCQFKISWTCILNGKICLSHESIFSILPPMQSSCIGISCHTCTRMPCTAHTVTAWHSLGSWWSDLPARAKFRVTKQSNSPVVFCVGSSLHFSIRLMEWFNTFI